MQGATAGLRVLDLTEGMAGSLATMVLADFGAEVIRVASTGDSAVAAGPSQRLLQRGKQLIDLDPRSAAGLAEVRRLTPSVDIAVVGLPLCDPDGVGYAELSALNRALIYCDITAFGRTGPLARVKAEDALVMARAGIFRGQAGWHADNGDRPVFRASRDASYFAAMLAVQGVAAAARARELTGEGQLVSVTMMQALTCRQSPSVRWLLREGEELPSEASDVVAEQDEANTLPHHRDPRQVNLIGMLAECKDGRWIVHSHTEPHFFPAWIKVLGFDWIFEDEKFKGAPYHFPDEAAKTELIGLVQHRMKLHTAAEWMELYLASGNVCGDVVQTTQEALRHPQLEACGGTMEVDDPDVGPVLQVGKLARISAVGSAGRQAPVTALAAGPLAGITIVEAAYYYATPFATALLADLGARVIKVEPVRGDPYRALAGGRGGGDPVLNLGHNNMVRSMQGKESIALNLKDPRGKEILHRLIAEADVFVHSFRPGVPESLGIDERTLRRIKPDLVYHYGASYGSSGPYSGQPAIDPVIAAFAGTTAHQAGRGNPPLTETGADPVAAAGHAAAMTLGLLAQQRMGAGQNVESAMIVSNVYLNCEDAVAYRGKPPRVEPDPLQLGTGATHRLYETGPATRGADLASHENPNAHWVFLAAQSDGEFANFCALAGREDIAADSRFSSAAARELNDAALSTLLEAIFLTRPAREWEASALAAGVGCVMADAMSHFAFLHRDAQSEAVSMMARSAHASFGGTYWRHAPVVGFSLTPGKGRAFCEKGEHTQSILRDLGYDDAAMAELKDGEVITWPAEQSETAMALP